MNNQTLKEIAKQYGTPSYVFDLDTFTARIIRIKELLGSQIKICYAMKANPFFTHTAALAADALEVCSPGEFAICQRAGIPPEKIVLSGVNKEPSEIEIVMSIRGAGTYTAESLNQLKLLEICATKTGISSVPVLLRVTSKNQFGMDEDTIITVLTQRDHYPHLDLKGLQYYSGTQKKKPEQINRELQYLDELCIRFKEEFNFDVQELEYGPGFHISYFQGEIQPNEDTLLKEFKKTLDSLKYSGIISLEMGRFLAAPCGSYLTRIADTKNNQGTNYGIIDGGINHINYYGQAMAMKIPPYRFVPEYPFAADTISEMERWTICGSLCTVGDVLVKNLPLPGAKAGDLLIFDRIGAYSVTEGIYLFLSRKLPRILFYSHDKGTELVREAISTDLLNSPMAETINFPVVKGHS